eukprot:GHVH01001838.1.p1 GENE.GHVH01001838.1~~GHVH01001838.1.p1  ORF type:complete len:305 (-),score=37.17 GHVH01001838.1:1342-2256(-)
MIERYGGFPGIKVRNRSNLSSIGDMGRTHLNYLEFTDVIFSDMDQFEETLSLFESLSHLVIRDCRVIACTGKCFLEGRIASVNLQSLNTLTMCRGLVAERKRNTSGHTNLCSDWIIFMIASQASNLTTLRLEGASRHEYLVVTGPIVGHRTHKNIRDIHIRRSLELVDSTYFLSFLDSLAIQNTPLICLIDAFGLTTDVIQKLNDLTAILLTVSNRVIIRRVASGRLVSLDALAASSGVVKLKVQNLIATKSIVVKNKTYKGENVQVVSSLEDPLGRFEVRSGPLMMATPCKSYYSLKQLIAII